MLTYACVDEYGLVGPVGAMGAPPTVIQKERDALLAIYDALDGPNWVRNGTWEGGAGGWRGAPDSVAVGEWFGVRVDSKGRVTKLELRRNRLAGDLPFDELAKLRFLEMAYFCCTPNEITGTLDGIGSLSKRLWYFEVGENSLTGGIPSDIRKLTGLRELILSDNQLDGVIAPAIGDVSNLEVLWLHRNNLTSLPRQLGQLKNLRKLTASENNITSPFHHAWTRMEALEYINLSDNEMTGGLPPSLKGMKNLQNLRIARNKFTGALPDLQTVPTLINFEASDNAFSGRIPAFGESLEHLRVGGNDLSGPLPIVENSVLKTLIVSYNPGLEGYVPHAYTSMPIALGVLYSTGLCIPPSADYDALRSVVAVPWSCDRTYSGSYIDRLALDRTFGNLGGEDWATQWDTVSVAGDRHGVTVSGDYVTEVDLSDNNLSGEIDESLSWLDGLIALDLSGNADLEGALPVAFTSLALTSLDLSGTDICVPPTSDFSSWLATIGSANTQECDNRKKAIIEIWPSMNQAIQRITKKQAGQVSLIAGRNARLRVWVTANKRGVYESPDVVAEVGNLLRHGVYKTYTIAAPTGELISRQDLHGGAPSYDVTIPGQYVQPGLQVVLTVGDAQTPISQSGTQYTPVVVEVAPLELTIVPVYEVGEDQATRDIADAFAQDVDGSSSILKYGFPLRDVTVNAGTPFTTDADLSSDSDSWRLIMDLIWAKWEANGYDHGSGYWYGVNGQSTARGIAESAATVGTYRKYCADATGWVSCTKPNSAPVHGPGSSVSFGRATIMYLAHEVGHTLSLPHSPCGGPADPDPNFPYADGTIGQWGYDFYPSRNWDVPATVPDVMGYCSAQGGWLSDYNYEKVMAYRDTLSIAPDIIGTPTSLERGRAMVVSGIIENGQVQLQSPAFVREASVLPPRSEGPYTVDVIDATGGVVFSGSFAATKMEHVAETFLFTVSLPDEAVVAEITITGPGGRWTLSVADAAPVTVVRERSTGHIVGVFRRGPPPRELLARISHTGQSEA